MGGCTCKSKSKPKMKEKDEDEIDKNYLLIRVIHPKTGKIIDIKYKDKDSKQNDLIMNVMNNVCFGLPQHNIKPLIDDGCFTTIYNEKTGRYHYYCHRLLFIEVENSHNPIQGKMWIPYINNKKEDWDLLIENNYNIAFQNTILTWKFESANIVQSTCQSLMSQSEPENNQLCISKEKKQQLYQINEDCEDQIYQEDQINHPYNTQKQIQ